jgi:hypothetical protein
MWQDDGVTGLDNLNIDWCTWTVVYKKRTSAIC